MSLKNTFINYFNISSGQWVKIMEIVPMLKDSVYIDAEIQYLLQLYRI